MTVKELIEKLSVYDESDEVVFNTMLSPDDDESEVYDITDTSQHLDIVELHTSNIVSS